MSKVGLQLDASVDTWRQRPSVLRRPLSRKPRVSERPSVRKHTSMREGPSHQRLTTHKRKQIRTGSLREARSVHETYLEEGIVPFETVGDTMTDQPTLNNRSHPVDIQKPSESVNSQPIQKHHSGNPTVVKNSSDTFGRNEESFLQEHKRPNKIKNKTTRSNVREVPHLRGRAMSYDDVFHRTRLNNAQYILPQYPVAPVTKTDSIEDVGNPIINNYSDCLEYEENIPKSTKRRSVRKFFRRLAGSLESLLKIGRKSKHRHSFHSYGQQENPKPYNNPLFANYSPYISVDESVPQMKSADVPTRMGVKESISKWSHEDITTNNDLNKLNESSRIAFSRGKRVYLSPAVHLEESRKVSRNPIPPKSSAGRRKRKQIDAHRAHVRSFTVVGHTKGSDDWETRSETDSESCMFRSDNLRLGDISLTISSGSEVGKDIVSNDGSNAELQKHNSTKDRRKLITVENRGNFNTKNVKISDFFPKHNTKETEIPATTEKVPNNSVEPKRRNLGPMKADHKLNETQDAPIRTASVGKSDVIQSKNTVRRRKVRRRNSSFLPGNQKETIAVETNLQQAASFEQIMGSLQEIVDNLGRVHVQNTKRNDVEDIEKDGIVKNPVDDEKHHKKSSNPVKRNTSRRRESWVGTVSNRLDKLIDSGSSKNVNEASSPNDPNRLPKNNASSNNEEQHTEPRPIITNKTNRNFIKCEKVSFDELEKDFRNFAQEIRQRERQSVENLNKVGQ